MRQVGCLGDIPFYVSDEAIQTIKNAKWGGSVQLTKHKRHLNDTLTEATGRDADTFDFEIKLSVFLGVNPYDAILKIWDYERNYVSLPLVLGEKAYGKYRWLITSHSTKFEHYDGAGNMVDCTVSLKLTEYQKKGR